MKPCTSLYLFIESKNETWLNNSSFKFEAQVSSQSISTDKKVDIPETPGENSGIRKEHRSKERMKKKKKKKHHHKDSHRSKLSR